MNDITPEERFAVEWALAHLTDEEILALRPGDPIETPRCEEPCDFCDREDE